MQSQQNQQNRTSNTGLQGRPGQGQQRYPAPIQRPNYSQSTQQINQSMPQRTRMSQPVNKHYYGNRGKIFFFFDRNLVLKLWLFYNG